MLSMDTFHYKTFFFFLPEFNILLVCLTNLQYIELPQHLLICIQNPTILCYQELQNTTSLLATLSGRLHPFVL